MRYERLKDIVRLAVRLQATRGGLTLEDIQADLSVSRRTAERMRDAVDEVFGQLERVDTGDAKHHWRLRSDVLRRLVTISPDELAELDSAASALERAGLEERVETLRDLAAKLRAMLRTGSLERIASELEALVQAEGLAMRAGPKPRLDPGVLSTLREAITTCRVVDFRYFARTTGQRSRQRVRPLGLLYGNRAFLVASSDWSEEPRLWRLANVSELRISDEAFERDLEFDLEEYAKRFVRDVPGGAHPGGAPVRRRGGARCLDFRLPSRPDHEDKRRRVAHGTTRGGWHRRDVLASLHLGGERHDRKASPASPAPGRDVRVVSGASQGIARMMSRLSTSVGVADLGLQDPQAARVHT